MESLMPKPRFSGPVTVRGQDNTSLPPEDDELPAPPGELPESAPVDTGQLTAAPLDDPDDAPVVTAAPRLRNRPVTAAGEAIKARRQIVSPYLQSQIQSSARKLGDTDIYLGRAAVAGLWIGIPMWANSVWD